MTEPSKVIHVRNVEHGISEMDPREDGYYTNLLQERIDLDYEFSTDCLDEIGRSSPISPQVESTTKKRSGNFTPKEDHMLISAYLNTSLDPVQGNEQKSRTYWLRVWEFFHTNKDFTSERTQGSLMNRWSSIQLATNKFCGYFAQIQRLNQSGLTEKDKIRDAKILYKEMHKSSFPFEHCWNELKDQPKWMEECRAKKQKTKNSKIPSSSSPSTPDSMNLGDSNASNDSYVDLERPPGRKAEKVRLNKRNNKDSENEGSSFMKVLVEIKDEKKRMNDKKIEFFERSLLQDQERLKLNQSKEEERIMSMDTSGMPLLQAEWVNRRQMDILGQNV